MIKIKTTMLTLLATASCMFAGAQGVKLSGNVFYYEPGAVKVSQAQFNPQSGSTNAAGQPLSVKSQITSEGGVSTVTATVTATRPVYFRLEYTDAFEGTADGCLYYMPGFWYHKNMRSPKEAPSFKTSKSWTVREDRLSSPLTGIFNESTGRGVMVLRSIEPQGTDCLAKDLSGNVVLSGKTTEGYTGFVNADGNAPALSFGFPYKEQPTRYIRKLQLIPGIATFEKLSEGESVTVSWKIKGGNYKDYSEFVAGAWQFCFDVDAPAPLTPKYTDDAAKDILSNYFRESFVDKYDAIKYLSSGGMDVATCASVPEAEVGFVGRTLLNAFNAIEYGEAKGKPELVKIGNAVIDSYLEKGFNETGFFIEWMNAAKNEKTKVFSIRRQSEGVMAMFYYLQYEKLHHRSHAKWEARLKTLLNNFVKMQKPDGSFARKFDASFKDVDPSGGSTPCATLALAMGYKYFKNKGYLEAARKTISYLEKNIISTSDYFSSTLDANCEDKEASFYACDALYYISFVTKGKERQHYIDLCKKAAYFCASWYYTWDVPFATGQMLGDLGFKSRGWGNVSVENNHIDVYIFEFATILKWLTANTDEPRFAKMADVIHSSMLQLLPTDKNLCGVGKVGYNPEVVQHTTWDYGRNGKGFYNNIFAPGWTVASLWTLLSADRVSAFFGGK